MSRYLLFGIILIFGIVLLVYGLQQYFWPTVVIEWSTASELDTVGFNVLRSESQEGPTIQVNSTLIPPAEDPLTGGTYTFEDKTVKPGTTYYYFLEDIDAQGNKQKNGPQKVVASQDSLLESFVALLLCLVSAFGLFRSYRQVKKNG